MNIAEIQFTRIFKIPNQLIFLEKDPYVLSVYLYLSERRNYDLTCLSLQSCLAWHKLNTNQRKNNHGTITPAGKIDDALLKLQEMGYISNFDSKIFKNNQHIELKCQVEKFEPSSHYVITNNAELEILLSGIESQKIILGNLLKTFLYLRHTIRKNMSSDNQAPMAIYSYCKNLAASLNISQEKLKTILIYLNQIKLMKIIELPRKKYPHVIKRRPLFIAFTYELLLKHRKLELNGNYNADEELISAISFYERKGKNIRLEHYRDKATDLFSKSALLNNNSILEDEQSELDSDIIEYYDN